MIPRDSHGKVDTFAIAVIVWCVLLLAIPVYLAYVVLFMPGVK